MSLFKNPSVGIESVGDGIVAGYQGGRPLDGVVVVDASEALERPGSPVAPEVQPVQKRGRITDEEMLLDDIRFDGVHASSGLEGVDPSPAVPTGTLNQKPMSPSFKDKLMGANGASHKQFNITELDVEVREEDGALDPVLDRSFTLLVRDQFLISLCMADARL
ncbi:hypothetical protein V6N13_072570 [Hibiscus sabdariffa]